MKNRKRDLTTLRRMRRRRRKLIKDVAETLMLSATMAILFVFAAGYIR